MLPRAFLEPFVSRKSRGTGHLASSSFTTKRTRNGRDPRRIPPLRIEFDHLFAGTKHENVANFLEFIYLFIYFLFFREGGGGGGQENFGTSGESLLAHTNDTEFNSSTQVFRTWRKVRALGLSRHVYTFSMSRERERKNRSVILSLELCINFHRF